ncbi:hypothetical protein C0992_008143 [Termitomyces sp. T32_za158]|nr:hypothetical protein C0992_008143 [Termitomyces sp. T32_za158]
MLQSLNDKVLSITCDNASCNDVMVEELAGLLPEFLGAPHQTRCFAHIINLVAKSLLKQFDTPKKKRHHEVLDSNLDDVAEEIEFDNVSTSKSIDMGGADDDVEG